MFGSHNRIFVLLVDTVPPRDGFVLSTQQFFMMLAQGCNFLFKIIHSYYCLFYRCKVRHICMIILELF